MENQDPNTPPPQTTQLATPSGPEYDTPASIPTPAPPAPKHMPPWLAAILLILIALGLTISTLAIFKDSQPKAAVKVSAKPIPSTTKVSDPTANWKTYTDVKYGFSIKYPMSWRQTSEEFRDIRALEPRQEILTPDVECPTCGGFLNGLHIYINKNSDKLTAEAFAQKAVNEVNSNQIEKTAKLLKNPSFFSSFDSAIVNGLPGGGNPSLHAYIVYNATFIDLGFYGVDDKTANLMLQTFKFTDLEKSAVNYLTIQDWGVRMKLETEASRAYYRFRKENEKGYTYAELFDADFDAYKNKDGKTCANEALFLITRHEDLALPAEFPHSKPSVIINNYGFSGLVQHQSLPACAILSDGTTDQNVLALFSKKRKALEESFKYFEAVN